MMRKETHFVVSPREVYPHSICNIHGSNVFTAFCHRTLRRRGGGGSRPLVYIGIQACGSCYPGNAKMVFILMSLSAIK